MKPKKPDNELDLFRSQLSQIFNLRHPLLRLSQNMDRTRLEAQIDVLYPPGPGQPPLPTRLMVGQHDLKYAVNESDESVVARWVENPYWQPFCGYEFLQHESPLHPTSLVRWRERRGGSLESLREHTVWVAKQEGLLKAGELERVNVDTTVQEKAIAFPTDARLYHKISVAVVRKAPQMKRAAREAHKLKTGLGRVVRDVSRKASPTEVDVHRLLRRAERLLRQQRSDSGKLYSAHVDEVECIAKGKAHKRYEFGGRASFATTCDLGDRGHGVEGETQVRRVGKIPKQASRAARKWMKRRAAIEPTLGHLKSDHRLSRNYLKGRHGEAAHVVLAAVGYNFAKLLAGFSCAWRNFRHFFLRCREACPATQLRFSFG